MTWRTFVFVLSGLWLLPGCFPRDYFLVRITKTWHDARSYCKAKYSDLASYDNEEDMKRVFATGSYYYNGHLWIGLYDDVDSWRWSMAKRSYYGEGGADFRMWKRGEPNNIYRFENCAEMDAAGFWKDAPCDYEKQFTCYNATSSSFIFVHESKTWKEAQSFCRKHHTDLASVRNKAENEQIRMTSQNRPTWIGLYRNSWRWTDGRLNPFSHWHKHNAEPNGDISSTCVLIHQNQWEDKACDTGLYFVCQLDPVKRRMLRITAAATASSVDLEDEAHTMLLQLSQTLPSHGLSKDVRLTWRTQPHGNIFVEDEE